MDEVKEVCSVNVKEWFYNNICGAARVVVFGRGADSSDARHHIDAQRSAEIVLDLMREDEIRLTTMQCAM